ncbi:MAG: glutamate synthase large subunit [Bacteroidota bacterium]
MVESDQSVQGEQSLYVPQLEHDACGIGFIAHIKGQKSHQTVEDALTMLTNMEHRGACGCDPDTGDGAGILIQVPDTFLREELAKQNIELPAAGKYGVGMCFFPDENTIQQACKAEIEKFCKKLEINVLGYRKIAYSELGIGKDALKVRPSVEQLFVAPKEAISAEALERKLYILRRALSHHIEQNLEGGSEFYFTSFSHKTIVYKGQLRTDQVRSFFLDLHDERVVSALALVHSRFSTNTFPNWRLAQPFRYIAHNGEINTIRGNVNWMRSKEALMECEAFSKEEMDMLFPICDNLQSDSSNLDAIVELLVMSGRSLPHVMMMLIPEAWQDNDLMDEDRKAFYEYHSTMMEPWDGPASICFTDGEIVGATLDRNGLRPSRYTLTKDDRLIMASEAGALPIDPSLAIEKGRLQPGKIFVLDMKKGRIIRDEELKKEICTSKPYRRWLLKYKMHLSELLAPPIPPKRITDPVMLRQRQQLFGITSEELKMVLSPMADTGKEPIGSMGADTPLAILSNQSQHISHYFKQLFAQVSNPPIDPIREKLVMSLQTWIGSSKNVLAETPEGCKQISLPHPILTGEEFEKIRQIRHPDYQTINLDGTFALGERLESAVDRLCEQASDALKAGANILIISDRNIGPSRAPIPALLAVGAVHHHLIRTGNRGLATLVLETGEAREVHHFATLIGYGALAIHPYMAYESIHEYSYSDPKLIGRPIPEIQNNYIQSLNYGLRKVLSKMGISTLQSYHGAMIFEILGLSQAVVDKCFTGSVSRIEGLGFEDIAKEILIRHKLAFKTDSATSLEIGGLYQWKRKGEKHLLNPKTIHLLQKSTRSNDYQLFKEYSTEINSHLEKTITLRHLLDFKDGQEIPLDEVEPVANILKRFATGAMSFGSLSHEAHSTLAIAMNRIGGKSNSGEGGEDEIRFQVSENGDWERSAVKQVASGRFGVTSYYLSEAEELQIKMAQGAKPGEGGQLPGHKVDEWIGRVRHATPGVGLISPPPHHDIYSIEDLAQLIYDLKNANREARISVKLVSEAGVGTIAAGVSKAHADHILISGSDGGTGASPLSSIRHAGLPWELGLAEAHQTLVKNDLRSRVTLQVDGQIRTGRDMAIATLLGAEEWGVATAALIVEGCIMMRKCHLNTCPVGIATQDPELRKLFSGKAEDVVNFFTFLAEEMREYMAKLGFRTVEEMVGQVQHLKVKEDLDHWKLKTIDFSPILFKAQANDKVGLYKQVEQDHGIDEVVDWELLASARNTLNDKLPTFKTYSLRSVDRSVGTLLSHEISKAYKSKGLPQGTLHYKFRGSAGQSFGAFAAPGLRLELEGEANDYFGKGLSGAELIVYPDKNASYRAERNIIVGNVAFYGGTSGEAFINGLAGERFAVRNSGVKAVVEGVGDHACEYMTGGTVVVLGPTGRNFAAGMSGGIAYVYDPKQLFPARCNMGMVGFEALEYEDVELLHKMINRHYTLSGSKLGLKLINDWPNVVSDFIKVMPTDYKAALLKRKTTEWQQRNSQTA